jgi:hypothetical protein
MQLLEPQCCGRSDIQFLYDALQFSGAHWIAVLSAFMHPIH